MITAPNTSAFPSQPARETWLQMLARTRYFSLSLVLHILAVITFGTIILQHAVDDPTDFETPTEILVPTGTAPEPAEQPEERVPETGGGEQTEVTIVTPKLQVLTSNAVNSSFTLDATTDLSSLVGNISNNVAGIGGGTGGGKGGTGMGMGGTSMTFLGAKVVANDVVLCLDVSSSMIGAPKSEKTYEVLEKEACNVIRGLKDGNKFGVIVFSREAKAYQEHLVKATGDEKARAIAWLKRMSPLEVRDPRAEDDVKNFHHGTRADMGLKLAFAMKPDVIFFVSDGEPTGARVPDILVQVQQDQAPLSKFIVIHTIAYLADGGQAFMKELAAKNQGTFSEVNPKDLK